MMGYKVNQTTTTTNTTNTTATTTTITTTTSINTTTIVIFTTAATTTTSTLKREGRSNQLRHIRIQKPSLTTLTVVVLNRLISSITVNVTYT